MTELRELLINISEEKQTKILPENLKVGVEAFGVTGNFTSDADATAADILKDKTAYVNGEKIIGTKEQASGEYNAVVDLTVKNGSSSLPGIVNSIKKLPDNLVPSGDSTNYMFAYLKNLETAPTINMSKIKYAQSMFTSCSSLKTVPYYDISSVLNINYMFNGCSSLSDESLNTIMLMCINNTVATNKTLKDMGLSYDQQTKCKSLSNYQAFLDAGWKTGY